MIRVAVVVGALLELLVARLLPESGVGLYFRLAAATIVVFVPGGLIAEALGRRSASASVIWTLAAITVALAVVFALGTSLVVALFVLAAISAGALAVASRRALRPPRLPGSAIVFVLGAIFGILLWQVAREVGGDGFFHLARVRKLTELDDLYLATLNEFADGVLHPGYACPLWHGFRGLVAMRAGVDPALVVEHEASVLAPVAFLVVFEAGTVLFRSAWLGGAVLAGNTAIIALAAGHGGSYTALGSPPTASR